MPSRAAVRRHVSSAGGNGAGGNVHINVNVFHGHGRSRETQAGDALSLSGETAQQGWNARRTEGRRGRTSDRT